MIEGKKISKRDLWEEYYTNLHKAYNAMFSMFKKRDISQDALAKRLDVDKALISKRLKGRENLTLKTLSFMASAMKCRLDVQFVPYEEVQAPKQLPVLEQMVTVGGNAAPITQSDSQPDISKWLSSNTHEIIDSNNTLAA